MDKVQSKEAKRIELGKAEAIADHLRIHTALQHEFFEACGSVRRCAPYVSDLDIVVMPLQGFREALEALDGFGPILWQGDRKLTALYASGDGQIQLDFMFAHDAWELPAMIMHCTGSKWFNIKCRKAAKEKGYKLNEYGLWYAEGPRLPCRCERDIFAYLGMDYVNPMHRE